MVGKVVPRGPTATESVSVSYELAREHCIAKVTQIIKECHQINQKYSDPHFDLNCVFDSLSPLFAHQPSGDIKDDPTDTQYDMVEPDATSALGKVILYSPEKLKPRQPYGPPTFKRVSDIFETPQFFVEGATAKDVRQGSEGDCWFLSAIAALCSVGPPQNLIEKVCVKWDQDVGVYGFVLYRDGEWQSVIVDDKLYLRSADYEDSDVKTRQIWENNRVRIHSQMEYKKEFQTNSRALYYAQSTDPNETWVPLLEKRSPKPMATMNLSLADLLGNKFFSLQTLLQTTNFSLGKALRI